MAQSIRGPRAGRVRVTSCRRTGRLNPRRPKGLRAGAVVLKPGACMEWHSTRDREELLIVLEGWVELDVATSRRTRRRRVPAGCAAFLGARTEHRVLNRSARPAAYVYVTAPAGLRGSVT